MPKIIQIKVKILVVCSDKLLRTRETLFNEVIMSDKKEQLNLKLGEVEYIVDPNFIPERYVDKIGIDNLESKHFFELLQDDSGCYDVDFDYGDYDEDTFVIVHSWNDLANIIAKLNGWTGDCVRNHFSGSTTLEDEIKNTLEEYNKAKDAGKGTYGYESKIKELNNLKDYQDWIEANEYDEVDLDSFGIEVGFSDEYSRCACGNCNKVVRTSPDSYCWTAPLFIACEGYVSDDCVSDGNFDDYILEQYANEQKSIPAIRSPEDLGLVKINEDTYQNGMHYGMDDSPEPILNALNDKNIDVWFVVHPSQFYCDFDVYVKSDDLDRAKSILEGTDTYQGYSTAGNMEKALKSVSSQARDCEGVAVTTVDVSTGTSETKVVSKQDFIDGKALK